MKKRILFLLPLFLGACSDKGESPSIQIEKLYVNAGSGSEMENFASRLDELPALEVGDEVEAFLFLDGNGAELKSFNLLKDDELAVKLVFEKAEVSMEGNLTDEDNGQLRFKDGVMQSRVMVHATIKQVDETEDAKLNFYLSSKADCEGAEESIGLKTTSEKENQD